MKDKLTPSEFSKLGEFVLSNINYLFNTNYKLKTILSLPEDTLMKLSVLIADYLDSNDKFSESLEKLSSLNKNLTPNHNLTKFATINNENNIEIPKKITIRKISDKKNSKKSIETEVTQSELRHLVRGFFVNQHGGFILNAENELNLNNVFEEDDKTSPQSIDDGSHYAHKK